MFFVSSPVLIIFHIIRYCSCYCLKPIPKSHSGVIFPPLSEYILQLRLTSQPITDHSHNVTFVSGMALLEQKYSTIFAFAFFVFYHKSCMFWDEESHLHHSNSELLHVGWRTRGHFCKSYPQKLLKSLQWKLVLCCIYKPVHKSWHACLYKHTTVTQTHRIYTYTQTKWDNDWQLWPDCTRGSIPWSYKQACAYTRTHMIHRRSVRVCMHMPSDKADYCSICETAFYACFYSVC